ncbi:fungal-specific transcription factor domain-containing protein [Talaromyces proteolyticus]|uniref:Fungal-specific transcription factor domain-containing protein n=1 Tax=Talaromyces proteolyticus TaxID=1131652 RepID=A0AAD4KZP6_9EURO|nr:fungal-specific transcription factor domain-containing protein [Talaromyces proteolyticus]KAH8704867.1 fungal-specific transcription factor domain-containing protein [Talaromyces proteolyticus]
MATISNYTSVFRAFDNCSESRRGSKRNRQPVSCHPCRVRKLKCDRQHPCGACTSREEASRCDFIAKSKPDRLRGEKPMAEIQGRLQNLEKLLESVMHADPPKSENVRASTRLETAELHSGTETPGHENTKLMSTETTPQSAVVSDGSRAMSMASSESSCYIGATSWRAILDTVRNIQDSLLPDDDISQTSVSETTASVDIISGRLEHRSLEELISGLPPRPVVDRLLFIFFNTGYMNVPFLHALKVQSEMCQFWEKPTSVSFLWLSILFSMLCIAADVAISKGQASNFPYCNPERYMIKSGECLVSGEYLKVQPLAVEALTMYALSKYMRNEDSDPALWSLFGLATRLAHRMGYHRDPRSLAISPFEAEMRRRVWFYIESFDVLFSFQLGMPPIIHGDECDTDLPGNYSEADFPEDSPTLMLFYTHKARLIRLFRRVLRVALSTRSPDYEEIQRVDEDLQALYHEVPPYLKARPIHSSGFMDQGHIIIYRLILEQLHLQSLCILHRIYFTHELDDSKYDRSRDICRNSALQLLDMQAEVYRQSQPTGRLHDDRWMVKSISHHAYLVAGMVLCLDISVSTSRSLGDRIREINALKISYHIWSERRTVSQEAAHAARVLATILARVKKMLASSSSSKHNTQSKNTDLYSTKPTTTIMTPPDTILSANAVTTLDERLSAPISTPFIYHQPSDTQPSQQVLQPMTFPSTTFSTFDRNLPPVLDSTAQYPANSESTAPSTERNCSSEGGSSFNLDIDDTMMFDDETLEPLANVLGMDSYSCHGSGSLDWSSIDRYLLDQAQYHGAIELVQ